MRDAYIVSAARTPIGRFGGALAGHSPADLAAHAMRAALDRADVDGANLDLYIFGNVLRAGHGQLIPRQGAFKAGIPKEIDGYAIDMVCSSGMMAVINAMTAIRAGEVDLVLAGGTESMSQAGFLLTSRARWGYKYLGGQNEPLIDLLAHDGLTDPMTDELMGDETERLAAEHGITRDQLDEVAFHSQNRAAEAIANGAFQDEIAPVEIKSRKGDWTLDKDEGVREGTTLESLGKLRPAFAKEGVITAGNASQLSDGAAALLIASKDAVDKYGLTPIAKVLGGSWAAGETWRFPEAPIPAVERVVKKTGLTLDDFALVENNEAFAVSSVLINKMLGVSYDKLNVNGGAIALGHPIGATGARIITTLVHALRNRGESHGLAALCHGTGGGTAVAIEAL